MSRFLAELDRILLSLIDEHRKLLVEVEKHQAAIKGMNVTEMEASRTRQEAARTRITALENRRKQTMAQITAGQKIPSPTLTQLAEIHPQARTALLGRRDELRAIIGQISQRTQVTAKVTGAVLGHLNTVMRLLSGALKQAGVYTKQGIPRGAPRIGVMEAVG